MVKVTFTFDEETVARLRQVAERLERARSWVVREAICDYAERVDRLSERERRRMLELFDTLVPAIPTRPAAEVEAEIRSIRRARRSGGRRHRTSGA
jgi:hypothetical protein